MEPTQQYREYLKTAAPAFGQLDDAGVEFLDDNSALVTVQYLVPAERWEALEAEWKARAASDSDASGSSLGSAEPMTSEVTEGPFYLLDHFGGVVMGDDSPLQFDTEEEAERWADANLWSWQIMEGKLGPYDVFRPPQRATPDR